MQHASRLKWIVTSAVLSLALASCGEVQDELARAGARSAVDQVLVQRFPNVNAARVTPYTDCVIEEASAGQITRLAADAVSGVDAETAALVLEISARPDAASCLLNVGLSQTL